MFQRAFPVFSHFAFLSSVLFSKFFLPLFCLMTSSESNRRSNAGPMDIDERSKPNNASRWINMFLNTHSSPTSTSKDEVKEKNKNVVESSPIVIHPTDEDDLLLLKPEKSPFKLAHQIFNNNQIKEENSMITSSAYSSPVKTPTITGRRYAGRPFFRRHYKTPEEHLNKVKLPKRFFLKLSLLYAFFSFYRNLHCIQKNILATSNNPAPPIIPKVSLQNRLGTTMPLCTGLT